MDACKESRFLISCADHISMKCITQRNGVSEKGHAAFCLMAGCVLQLLIASVFNVRARFLPVEQLMQQAACLPGHRECLGWNYSGNSILATVFPMGSSASSPSQAVCAPAIRQGARDRLLLLSKHYTWLAAHVCREWVSPRAQWITQARWTQPGDWELRLPVMEAWQDTMVGNAVQAWTH